MCVPRNESQHPCIGISAAETAGAAAGVTAVTRLAVIGSQM